MDKKTESLTLKTQYFFLIVAFVFNGLQAGSNLWILLFLSGLIALSVTTRHILFYVDGKCHGYGWLTYFIDILLAFLIGTLINRDGSAVFFLIILCDACLTCPRHIGHGVAGFSFAAFVLCKYLGMMNEPLLELLSSFSLIVGAFISVTALITIMKYEMETRQSHDMVMYELKTKSKQLEDAYRKLKETAKMQEEVSILRERTRIAREMHDSVGHALTTGLISLEAGERLIETGNDLAVERIHLAKTQVRKGLTELRQTVMALKSNTGDKEFLTAIRDLLEDTRKQGISIHEDIAVLPKISSQKEAVLYRALQEGLTNGLKHGNSTAFVFQLMQEDKNKGKNVLFLLEDNGSGCKEIVPGFGLTTMKQRVNEAHGSFSITSENDEGCRIEITMPIEE